MGYLADTAAPEQFSPTMTDRYHFTTAYAYWVEGRLLNPASAYIFGRKPAEGGTYTVEAGKEGIIDLVKNWKNYGLTSEDRLWLQDEGYPEGFINDLHNALKDNDTIQIYASRKHLFFPQEPAVRIDGPIALIKMLESPNLCIENGQSADATHSARMGEVLEADVESGAPKGIASIQGLRRGPTVIGNLEKNRALLYGGGYKSTSTGRAAEMLGAKFAGTMDHAWVQTHNYQLNKEANAPTMRDLFCMKKEGRIKELQEALSKDAFRSYAFTNPKGGIFLTDTYDTLTGIEDAITVLKEMRNLTPEELREFGLSETGIGQNYGMRFDSDDLIGFSKTALRRLAERNENGDLLNALPDGINVSHLSHRDLLDYAAKSTNAPFCAVSDGVDIYSVQKMREEGAYIKGYGVGTAGSHVPALGLVQKVAAMVMETYHGGPIPEDAILTPTSKIVSAAPAKSSSPGLKLNSRRFYDAQGKLSHVVVYDEALGFDPEQKIVNLRDFSDVIINPGGTRQEDILEPLFGEGGRYVYNEPPKKPDHPGSTYMVTDLDAVAASIRAELSELPDDMRVIHRPREQVLNERLVAAFKQAKQNGGVMTIDVAEIEASLPPVQRQVPVYFDNLLYLQRLEVENRHHMQKRHTAGVDAYTERFELNH